MAEKYTWKSAIGHHIKNFLDYKRLSGYKYEVAERWLRQFDIYCLKNKVPENTLSRQVVEDFCYGEGFESKATYQDRLCLLRNLAEYMIKCGCNAYITPKPVKAFRYPKHEPYLFSEKEIRSIFEQIDEWEQPQNSRTNRKTVDPVLFRMLYGCGLRIMEALRLTVDDVDLEQGVLRIHQSKNNKDRFVPMSESLTKYCIEYKKVMHQNSNGKDYFFPGFHGRCYSNSAIYVRFRQYLWKAGISHTGSGPRLHDFRHVYCVHRLKKWIMAGEELTNLLPYLSVYLGHSDFRGTEYYLKLTADLYPEIISKLEKSHGHIIPKRGVDIT